MITPAPRMALPPDEAITGTGFTVSAATMAEPLQPLAAGVMVYVAVPLDEVVAVNVWAMLLPLLFDAPLSLFCETVHENVVPLTLFGLVIAMDVGWPENIAWFDAEAVGAGLTVAVTFIAVPVHPLLAGVMV